MMTPKTRLLMGRKSIKDITKEQREFVDLYRDTLEAVDVIGGHLDAADKDMERLSKLIMNYPGPDNRTISVVDNYIAQAVHGLDEWKAGQAGSNTAELADYWGIPEELLTAKAAILLGF